MKLRLIMPFCNLLYKRHFLFVNILMGLCLEAYYLHSKQNLMKKLLLFSFLITLTTLSFAQTNCSEQVDFYPNKFVADVVRDEQTGISYAGGNTDDYPLFESFLEARADTGFIWSTSYSCCNGGEPSEVTRVTDVLKLENKIASVGSVMGTFDVADVDKDGLFFKLNDINSGEELYSIRINRENLINLGGEDYSNYDISTAKVIQLPDGGFWVSGFQDEIILVEPEDSTPLSRVRRFISHVKQMNYVTDSLIAVSTQDSIFLFDAYTQTQKQDWSFAFGNGAYQMDANSLGELFIAGNGKILKVYPDEEMTMDILPDPVSFFKCDGAGFLLVQNGVVDQLIRYEAGQSTEIHAAANSLRKIGGAIHANGHYRYWGHDYYSHSFNVFNPFVSIQPEAVPTCDYNRDLELLEVTVLDTMVDLRSADEWEVSLDVDYVLSAKIVNHGAPVEYFSIVNRFRPNFFTVPYYRHLKQDFNVSANTGDTVEVSGFILSTTYVVSNPVNGLLTLYLNLPMAVGTPDHKQDVFENNNTFILEYSTTFLTDVDDIAPYDEAVSLFPNPTSQQFQLTASGGHAIKDYIIYDTAGQERQAGTLGKAFSGIIKCADLPAGLYWVDVGLEGGQHVIRQLVIH